MRKIKLSVLGISYSQTQSGAYALILAEEGGERRLPIIIGGFEAQAIVIRLENLNPPRPLTHDLLKNFADLFDIGLKEVFIHKLDEGVFYSQLICEQGGKDFLIDSRTSDAVALALRFECPIFISEEIMEKAGIIISESEINESLKGSEEDEEKQPEKSPGNDYTKAGLTDLRKMLDDAIQNEDYETAAAIRDEIDRRESGNK